MEDRPNPVAQLLLRHIPRDLVMGVEEALRAGAQRAYVAAAGMNEGHLAHVVGQLRHFHMNEAFHRALAAGNASPTPICGNGLVTGRVGGFTVARFNIPAIGFWLNGRRSRTRRQMAIANKAIEPLVQPSLFGQRGSPSEGVAFFVACFSGSLHVHPEVPASVHIAVPDHNMEGWLFREPLGAFLHRYDDVFTKQDDLAMPRLKRDVGKRQNGELE